MGAFKEMLIRNWDGNLDVYRGDKKLKKEKTIEIMKEELVSLYEYLGKPAGGELGKRVAECATKNKEII